MTISSDYLNSKLEDGLTVKEHMRKGYDNNKNSSNPKYHRTFEEELSFEFSEKHSKLIDKFENIIYSSINLDCSNLDKIKESIDMCNKSIIAYYELKNFCYKSKGGKIYFQDMWEYCDNSTNVCFEYVEQLYKSKGNLLDLYYKNKMKGKK